MKICRKSLKKFQFLCDKLEYSMTLNNILNASLSAEYQSWDNNYRKDTAKSALK